MKIVKQFLKEGVNKKDIFEKAMDEGLNSKRVSKYLAKRPDVEEAKKYEKANYILIGIYAVTVLLGLLNVIPLFKELSLPAALGLLAFSLLIPAALIYAIFIKDPVGYFVLAFLFIRGVLLSFSNLEVDPVGAGIDIAVSIGLVIYIVILKGKLFPYQSFFHTKKADDGTTVFTK
ncbi:hypothetical protein EOL70_06390 [Leucothrix sargassi]|nr:hypothetical protein EOL70_06390 [Leucothrix sargassi]